MDQRIFEESDLDQPFQSGRIADQKIMEDGPWRVSTTLAVLDGVSYPIRNIAAISVSRPPFGGFRLAAGIVCLIAAAALVSVPFLSTYDPQRMPAILLGFVGIVLVIAAFIRPRYLLLRTNGGSHMITGRNATLIKVRGAIEQAVRMRG